MTLRLFIISLSAALIAIAIGAFYFNSKQILGAGFQTLEETHIQSVTQTAESLIETKTYALKTIASVLKKSNQLSSKILISKVKGNNAQIKRLLNKEARRAGVDFLDVRFEGEKNSRIQKVSFKIKKTPQIASIHGEPVLLHTAGLINYGERIGTLAFGYFLNETIAPIISKSTRTTTTFTFSEKAHPLSILSSDQLRIEVGRSFIDSISDKTQTDILNIGAICIAVVILLLFLLTEFGFVRGFRKVLRSIENSAAALDRGTVLTPDTGEHRIREITLLSQAFKKFSGNLKQYEKRLVEESKDKAYIELAEQVVHDLKSPISALELVCSSEQIQSLPEEETDLMKKCLIRIREILTVLDRRAQIDTRGPSEEPFSIEHLPSLVRAIILEKRAQYQKRGDLVFETGDLPYNCFSQVQNQEFRRMLSNVLDNAAQAIEDGGKIQVNIANDGDRWNITILDNGPGIPEEHRAHIFERGYTTKIHEGSGLGLWSARKVLSHWGGAIVVDSIEDEGTQVSLKLNKAKTPRWFADHVSVSTDQPLTIFGSSEATKLISTAFKKKGGKIFCPNSIQELAKTGTVLFHELPEKKVAKTLLSEAHSAYLVTDQLDSQVLQKKSEILGMTMVPKSLGNEIPIAVNREATC